MGQNTGERRPRGVESVVYCSPDRCDDTITRAESTVAHAAAACMYSPHSALRVKRSSSLLTSSTEQTDRCGENDSTRCLTLHGMPHYAQVSAALNSMNTLNRYKLCLNSHDTGENAERTF